MKPTRVIRLARQAAAQQILSRMARLAQQRMSVTGFCTDDDFAAAGFKAAAIKTHGNLARHRAVQAMGKQRDGADNNAAEAASARRRE